MSVYLDASVLVALLTEDPHTSRAYAFLRKRKPVPVVSDFAAAEFASAVARRVRMGEINSGDARSTFRTFDAWLPHGAVRADLTSADISTAIAYLRRLDSALRTPDALNIAIAERVGADLLTFDIRMEEGARALGARVLVA